MIGATLARGEARHRARERVDHVAARLAQHEREVGRRQRLGRRHQGDHRDPVRLPPRERAPRRHGIEPRHDDRRALTHELVERALGPVDHARVVARHQAHVLVRIGLLRGRRVLERPARDFHGRGARVGPCRRRRPRAAHALRQPHRPHHAAQHVGRLVAQRGLLGGQEQTQRPSLDDVHAPPARRQLPQDGARVAPDDERPAVGIEQQLRELGVAARRGDLHEAPGQDALDLDAVAERGPLRAHGLQRAHEHLLGQPLDEAGHDAPRLIGVLLGRGAQPRVHVRDGLVVAVRGQRRQRQLLLEDRARDGIDVLAHQGAQRGQCVLGLALQARAPRAGHRPQIARVAGRQGGSARELGVGPGEVAQLQRHEREVHVRQRHQAVVGPVVQERLELRTHHHGGDTVGLAPRLAKAVEERPRGRRGRQRRHRRGTRGGAPAGRPPGERRAAGEGQARSRGEAVAPLHALACVARA